MLLLQRDQYWYRGILVVTPDMADTEGLKNEIEQLKNAIKVRLSKDQICGFESIHYSLKIAFIRTQEKMALIWHDRPFCPDPGLLLAETSQSKEW